MAENPGAGGALTLCQRCHQRPATVQVATVVNGEKRERRLCEECAREEGAFHLVLTPVFTVQNLLGGLVGQGVGPLRPVWGDRRCGYCGYPFQRFAETGRLGCDRCYEAFADQLEPLIRRIQGRSSHHGKVPRRGERQLLRRRELEQLRAELRGAVEREEFERAAELRDRIRALEEEARQVGAGGEGA
ncbi:MAG: UvrB/UvrC motif-containing protein [Firmicutes bacterium]|nr:UvrB/UvrC motif-containing protein [Alicyclobacillaceae bacterium]MCL6498370.1 UvrB/UvrC motif-containing protein [Bacillota bacterium]